ncbi:HEAT repeat domain-containing protein [Roseovarius sp. EGI FJ00037]|uniref:HEAT repeat domain-containing protein n=1 Tax=Roseovarius TaxID=74030 RepID=UPI0022A812E4|nr:HEAT repeat domain-containing protein [Roseovarius sp. EGI FJ00037]MCZ0814213.1 HEAT repeat domain-containing protein [Roseovarius sp. EGI FJ00037]
MKASFLPVCFILAFLQPVLAQTLSIDELKAQIDQKVSSQDEFRELLNDPDPARSIAAMELMMASGDPTLERMAREFGVFSSDPVVRRLAIEAWLKSNPVLNITYDGSVTESAYFKNFFQNTNGSVNEDKQGFTSFPVNGYDEAQDCYLFVGNKNDCAMRITDVGPSIAISKFWAPLQLGDDGYLRGQVNIYRVDEPIPIAIPVTD